MKHTNLFTLDYDKLDKNNPLPEYPNPAFQRDSYFSLNGFWNYKITNKPNDLTNIDGTIVVPYPVESNNSLVANRLKKGEALVYKRSFTLPNDFIKKHTFINFLGVDQAFYFILNGDKYGSYEPLNLPTRIDISKSIKLENEIIVVVRDDLEVIYPLGKQAKKPKGIFYTPFSGIYYPVYLESLEDDYIDSIKIATNMSSVNIDICSTASNFNILIKYKDEVIHENIYDTTKIFIEIPSPKLWSIEEPNLYNLEIRTNTDVIKSYFGLRKIEMIDGLIYLNEKKVFLNGVLDQGYYPEGIITPSSYHSYEYDILSMKELGFNTLRKHIKIEMPYFYYLCDKHGMLVIQDFVNNGKYSFFRDTALPTLGFQKKNDIKLNRNKVQRNNFLKCGEQLINYLNNNPSIVAYTIFNEGWGQFDSDNVYKYFKSKYPNLIFDTTSGWFRVAESDVDSYHWYFNNIDKLSDVNHKVFISEFGALCYKLKGYAYGKRHTFGYTYFKSLEEAEQAFIDLYEKKIIPYKDKLVGTIYTQLSDVEEEDNGLLSYDRRVLKFNKEKVQKILAKLNN